MRLHLIGGPGSGKSLVARQLGERFDVPVLDLDEIYWTHEGGDYGDYDARADPAGRDEALAEFIRQDDWIVEGAYYRWLGEGFRKADRIFLVNTPRWVRRIRILRRFLRRKLGRERNRHESLRGLLRILRWNRRYDTRNRLRAQAMLDAMSLAWTACATLEEVLAELERPPKVLRASASEGQRPRGAGADTAGRPD